ncbi:DUF1801 domain-containing protein [Oricola sp.]|uniref:DUF1801 domain-containing protein n=1 Tax=Oricola sp. TaxID=1979950 RepID=UPI003BAC8351
MTAARQPLYDDLRRLIFEVAAATEGVGEIAESLKWGEPSFAPVKPRIGSSVRLAARPDGAVAMTFICHTGLVDRFRELYPGAFDFEGDRALVFRPEMAIDREALSHCIALAFTYHLRKRGQPL